MWSQLLNQQFSDFSEFADSVRAWDLDFKQLTSGRSACELQQFGSQNCLVTRFFLEQGFEQRGGAPKNRITFGIIDDSAESLMTPHGEVSQQSILLFSAEQGFEFVSRPRFCGCTLSVAESYLENVANITGVDVSSVLIGHYPHISRCNTPDLESLRRNLRAIGRKMAVLDKANLTSEVCEAFEFDLIHQLLLVLTDSEQEKQGVLTHRKKKLLQRAVDFIESNPETPITIRSLAEESGGSIRALEYAFRDYYGVTPKTYLTNRQLVQARRELQQAAPTERISTIASRAGFWHMGQFSRDYRKLFGELPSETLKYGNKLLVR
jgi:AraC family ethanolamine operon transcriptional activator